MTVTLYQTDGNPCDLRTLAGLLNRIQYFFVARVHDESVEPPPDLQPPLVDATALAEWFKAQPLSPPADFRILITSFQLALAAGDSTLHFDRGTAIICDHDWSWPPAAAQIHYARHALQAAMASFRCHTSNVASCICAPNQDFDCLCTDCQKHLADLDYRDGIARLKESFNTLNEIAWHVSAAALKTRHADQNDQTLRLATLYADQITQEEQNAGHPPPLQGMVILLVLHFLSDLIPFVKALRRLGCQYSDMHLIAKPYPYARRDEVTHALQTLGISTLRASKTCPVPLRSEQVLKAVAASPAAADKPILIVEDGGYFAPLLHRAEYSALLRRCIGVVEQTTKGITNDKTIRQNQLPILSVAGSTFKRVYESPEIGRVTVQNISRFCPNTKLSGRHAAIFGFGSTGQEVAYHLTNAFNMTVSVVDQDNLAVLRARHRKPIVAEAEETFERLQFRSRIELVIGSTGALNPSVTESILQELRDGTILVSTSSDREEIDVAALEKLARGRVAEIELGKHEYLIDAPNGGTKKLTLLAEGYPINFYASESLPNDTIDPIMTLLILCAVEMALDSRKNPRAFQAGIIPIEEVDEITKKRQLTKKFLELWSYQA